MDAWDALNREVGRRIRKLRKARGLSQTRLGDAIGVTFQQIGRYESGQNGISVANLVAVCRALKVKPVDILDGMT